MMVSTKAADAAGDDFARKPVGTGPFTFVEWVKDDRIVVRKNAQYWDKDASGAQLPYLDEIVYKPIPDGTQRLNALKTGTVDIIDIPPSKDIPTLKTGTDLVSTSAITPSPVKGPARRWRDYQRRVWATVGPKSGGARTPDGQR
jgi:ABC-type transport system substrate-binding protein